MKFEEFKQLVEERQELNKIRSNSKSKKEIDARIQEIEKLIFKEKNYIPTRFNQMFYVGTENVQKFLEKYFEGEDDFEIGFSGINLEFELIVNNKLYRLGNYDYNQTLKCLYFVVSQGWEELLKDYPDLKVFLWNEFKDFKTVKKRNELTLIQKRLHKRNEELEFLQNPESVQMRIRELKAETKKMEAQIAEISEDIEEVNFD